MYVQHYAGQQSRHPALYEGEPALLPHTATATLVNPICDYVAISQALYSGQPTLLNRQYEVGPDPFGGHSFWL